jgi:hypothetical protein
MRNSRIFGFSKLIARPEPQIAALPAPAGAPPGSVSGESCLVA